MVLPLTQKSCQCRKSESERQLFLIQPRSEYEKRALATCRELSVGKHAGSDHKKALCPWTYRRPGRIMSTVDHSEVVLGKALCLRLPAASLASLWLYLYCPSSLENDLEESCISELRCSEMYARRTARRLL
jgi:hypothetical protein